MGNTNVQNVTVSSHLKDELKAPTGSYNLGIVALILIMGAQIQNLKQLLPHFQDEMQTLMFVKDLANCDDVDQVFRMCFHELASSSPQVKGDLKDVSVARSALKELRSIETHHILTGHFDPAFNALCGVIRNALNLVVINQLYAAQTLMEQEPSGPHSAAYQFAKGIENSYATKAEVQVAEGGQIDRYTEGEQTQIFTDEAKQLGVDPQQAMDIVKSIAQAFKSISQDAMSLTGVQ